MPDATCTFLLAAGDDHAVLDWDAAARCADALQAIDPELLELLAGDPFDPRSAPVTAAGAAARLLGDLERVRRALSGAEAGDASGGCTVMAGGETGVVYRFDERHDMTLFRLGAFGALDALGLVELDRWPALPVCGRTSRRRRRSRCAAQRERGHASARAVCAGRGGVEVRWRPGGPWPPR